MGVRGLLLAVVLIEGLSGCGGGGDGLQRHEVSGTVTLDGQPLTVGSVQFQPGGGGQGPTVSGGAVIADGGFKIARDEGLVPGVYKVLIFSHGGAAQGAAPAMPGERVGGPPPELIPERYNAATTLTAEVKEGKPNVFAFELKK